VPPLVSCVVPVYNGERYLAEALDSILGQTHRPLQVLVADDGSTDGTAAVAAAYGERVVLLRQANAGPAAARNLGLGAALGEYVAFLDADDLWDPRKLERQLARFRARPELDYCVTLMRNFWVPELADEAAQYRGRRYAQELPGYVCQTLLARRGLFDRVGWFDPRVCMGEDNDWFLRANDAGAVHELVPEVLAFRRLHLDNMTRRHRNEIPDALLRIVKSTLDRRRATGEPHC
jgi:glycosyltransferase involved in cell wall biosynthesis